MLGLNQFNGLNIPLPKSFTPLAALTFLASGNELTVCQTRASTRNRTDW